MVWKLDWRILDDYFTINNTSINVKSKSIKYIFSFIQFDYFIEMLFAYGLIMRFT